MLEEFERCRPDRNRYRNPVAKRVGPGLVDLVEIRVPVRAPKIVPSVGEAGLEVVRTRNVRRVETAIVFGDKPSGVAA